MDTMQRRRPWLEALKGEEGTPLQPEVVTSTDSAQQPPHPHNAKSAKTSHTSLVDEQSTVSGEQIAWRVATWKAALPPYGGILVQKLRNCPETDAPGHCSLCGDVLPTDPAPKFPRCQPCIDALTLALNDTREE